MPAGALASLFAASERAPDDAVGPNLALRFETNRVEMELCELQGEASPALAMQWFMRSGAISTLGRGLIWLLLAGGGGHAQESQPTEYQIKAAFLFNFAKFVEWPPRAFAGATSPIVIGILGDNPFRDDLARTIQGKTIDEHPLLTKEYRSPAEATNCHILFISTSEKKRLPEIFEALKGTSVLTVSETDRFTESGGMINFFQERSRIRFQINKEAANGVGLKISAKLMNLATRPGG
jgi:hypothetical protein